MNRSKLIASVAAAGCIVASVVLVGVAGTVAVGIVAWLRQ